MKHSYFILCSVELDYPLYVAFCGSMTISDMRNHDVAWTVIRHLTQLDYKSFFVDKCAKRTFDNGLIKIDFTFK